MIYTSIIPTGYNDLSNSHEDIEYLGWTLQSDGTLRYILSDLEGNASRAYPTPSITARR